MSSKIIPKMSLYKIKNLLGNNSKYSTISHKKCFVPNVNVLDFVRDFFGNISKHQPNSSTPSTAPSEASPPSRDSVGFPWETRPRGGSWPRTQAAASFSAPRPPGRLWWRARGPALWPPRPATMGTWRDRGNWDEEGNISTPTKSMIVN